MIKRMKEWHWQWNGILALIIADTILFIILCVKIYLKVKF